MVAWGPSCHRHGERHGEIGLCKRYSRPHDGDDAHDDELRVLSRQCSYVFHRRWISSTFQFSHSSSMCCTGFWEDNLRHHCHLFSERLSTFGEDTRTFSCAQGARGKEGAMHVGDSGDPGDEQDVVHLRVGMRSGTLSHSNFGAHLKATCVNRYPPTNDPVSTSAFLHLPGTGNKDPATLPTLGSYHRLGELTRAGPCPV